MELEYYCNVIVYVIAWDPNKAIDIGERSICGGGQFEARPSQTNDLQN